MVSFFFDFFSQFEMLLENVIWLIQVGVYYIVDQVWVCLVDVVDLFFVFEQVQYVVCLVDVNGNQLWWVCFEVFSVEDVCWVCSDFGVVDEVCFVVVLGCQ